jgi:hypothetical protein
VELTVRVTGRNAKSTGFYVGLDRIVLRPVAPPAPKATEPPPPPGGAIPPMGKPPATPTDPVPPAPTPPPAQPPAPPPEPWTTKDVLDDRIDVAAQYALFRMFKGEAGERVVASDILGAVKSGALGGIYQEDQKVPALRAQAAGSGWWKILPKETAKPRIDGVCMTVPAGKPPILVMRRKAERNPAAYDLALTGAWAMCGLPSQPTRPYATTIPGKVPPAKGGRCASPLPTTQLHVGVFKESAEGIVGTTIAVQGPGGYQASQKTDASGLAYFEPPGSGLHLVIAGNLPGSPARTVQVEVLPKCYNFTNFHVGKEDTCAGARTRATGCLTPEVRAGSQQCNEAVSGALLACAGNEACLGEATGAYNACMEPVRDELNRCRKEILDAAGCGE